MSFFTWISNDDHLGALILLIMAVGWSVEMIVEAAKRERK